MCKQLAFLGFACLLIFGTIPAQAYSSATPEKNTTKFSNGKSAREELSKALATAEKSYRDADYTGAETEAIRITQNKASRELTSNDIGWDAQKLLILSYLKQAKDAQASLALRRLFFEEMELVFGQGSQDIPASVVSSSDFVRRSCEEYSQRLDHSDETEVNLERAIDSVIPRDYLNLLKRYCKRVDQIEPAMTALMPFALAEQNSHCLPGQIRASVSTIGPCRSASQLELSEAALDLLAEKLDALAKDQQSMPVGDTRPLSGLLLLAQVANHEHRYHQAETLARMAISDLEYLAPNHWLISELQLCLVNSSLELNKQSN